MGEANRRGDFDHRKATAIFSGKVKRRKQKTKRLFSLTTEAQMRLDEINLSNELTMEKKSLPGSIAYNPQVFIYDK